MKRGIITITGDGLVDIPDVPVWMTLQEIADLFGVFCLDIRRKMRTVYKEGVLTEKETKQEVKVDVRTSLEVYSLEFVVSRRAYKSGSIFPGICRVHILQSRKRKKPDFQEIYGRFDGKEQYRHMPVYPTASRKDLQGQLKGTMVPFSRISVRQYCVTLTQSTSIIAGS